jgi:hypothetical protein
MNPAPNLKHDVCAVARHFQIIGDFLSAQSYGSGHINDTYCVVFGRGGNSVRYILQRINHGIFQNPVALMENVQRVTTHLWEKTQGGAANSQVLTLIRANDAKPYYRDESGNYWRAYVFIENARTLDAVESPRQAYEAAKAFGRFQKLLADLPAPRLHDVIPDFHHTPRRFAALKKAIEADAVNRAKLVKPEIEFLFKREAIVGRLVDAGLPERVTHNDTKFNNVLLDDTSGEGICVIDLDTVMAGLALYDFGDLVRTATSPAKEDERDLSKVTMQFPMFEALLRGYLASASGFLTPAERRLIAFSGKLITFENGLRFLMDFLAGDKYFKVQREAHNLHRCRAQFKLVESIEQQEERMNRLVESVE